MAIHLTERPDHDCIMAPEDRLVSIKSADEGKTQTHIVVMMHSGISPSMKLILECSSACLVFFIYYYFKIKRICS